MKKGFVVSAVLYPLLIIALTLIMGVISMSDNRRKILDNMKLEVSEESETDPEMTNSSLYYKIKVLEEAYAELNVRFSEEYLDEIKSDYEKKIEETKTACKNYTDSSSNTLKSSLTTNINTAMSNAIVTAKLQAFPIGSIFVSTTSTNPSSYIGGTWQAYGSGRTLVGTGSGTDSNSVARNFALGTTGGEYNHTLTINEIPRHTHDWKGMYTGAGGTGNYISPVFGTSSASSYIAEGKGPQPIGGSASHNNIQPYIVVYFWKRIS